MQISSSLKRLALLFTLLTATCARPIEPPVSFATAGGDAWNVAKTVSGQANREACDAVLLSGPGDSRQMLALDSRGRFTASVALQPGDNRLLAECQNQGVSRGIGASQVWRLRLPDRPRAVAQLTIAGGNLVLDGSTTRPSEVSQRAIARLEWRQRDSGPEAIAGLPSSGERVTLPLPKAAGEYHIVLRATDAGGQIDESTAILRIRNKRATVFDPMREHANWVDDAVVYTIVPFLFGPRGFEDVTARLDHLAALGVNTLLLSPVKPAPEDDYGYAVADHFSLHPRYGTEADWRAFIAAAHQRGMRVVMDMVLNHTSDQHPYFADARRRRQASPYFDFYDRDASGAALHYFDRENLKNLNLDNAEVQNFLIEASAHWVRNYGIDGFRVDAAWGPRERRPDFWPRWAAELHRIRPDLLLIAAAPMRDPYYAQNGFDAAYDWTDKPGRWAWREAFDNEAETAARLREALTANGSGFPVLRFLNDNDTGDRFITRYGLQRTRLASAMLLTLPGLPTLFSGDEVGAAFRPHDDPPPIDWNDDPDNLRLWYAHLIRLRQQNAALRGQTLELIDTGSATTVLGYLRPGRAAGESIVVLLNYGAEAAQVRLPRVALRSLQPSRSNGRVLDLLNGATLRLQSGRDVMLPGYGVRILRAL